LIIISDLFNTVKLVAGRVF